MTLLILGIVLWYAGHVFKRVLPGVRNGLGEPGKGIAAVIILAGVVLMVMGYRRADTEVLYALPDWSRYLNNLLMLFAIMLFGMGGAKGRMRSWFRHPMLMGMVVWAVAHLLVNGDTASLLLFGSLLVWSLISMVIINANDGPWDRPEPGPPVGDAKLIVISLVLYAVIAGVHTWLGYNPFGA